MTVILESISWLKNSPYVFPAYFSLVFCFSFMFNNVLTPVFIVFIPLRVPLFVVLLPKRPLDHLTSDYHDYLIMFKCPPGARRPTALISFQEI
jgi:hypothetical protein